MKITLQELKQLIRESIQEEIKNEGIMDTVRGFFGGKKTPVETKPEEKSVDQNKPNIFTGGEIRTVEDFGKNPASAESEFYKWAVRTWSLGSPRAKTNIDHFLMNLKNAKKIYNQEKVLPDLWWRNIKDIANMNYNDVEPTYGDLLKVQNMAEFLLNREVSKPVAEIRNMVREEVKRQLRSKR